MGSHVGRFQRAVEDASEYGRIVLGLGDITAELTCFGVAKLTGALLACDAASSMRFNVLPP